MSVLGWAVSRPSSGRLLLLVPFKKNPQPFENQVRFVVMGGLDLRPELGGEPSGHHDLGLCSDLFTDLSDDVFDQADIAEIDTRLHAGDGGLGDGFFRLDDFSPGQLGRPQVEGLGRNLDPWSNRPPQVLSFGRDRVKSGGRAEVHDDAGAAVFFKGPDRSDHPVRPDFAGVLIEDGHPGPQAGTDDQGLHSEETLAKSGRTGWSLRSGPLKNTAAPASSWTSARPPLLTRSRPKESIWGGGLLQGSRFRPRPSTCGRPSCPGFEAH